MNILFSIIIPAYNAEAYLARALDSVQAQIEERYEVIIVNDGSSDATSEIAKRYVKQDSRFKLVDKENGGVSSARNAGAELASADWLAFLDADDFWDDNHLSSVVSYLNSSDAIVTDVRAVDQDGRVACDYHSKPTTQKFLKLNENIGDHCFINPSWLFLDKSFFHSLGGFDESPEIQHAEDWDLVIRAVIDGGRFRFTEKKSVNYRVHDSSANSNRLMMAKVCLVCINKNFQRANASMKRGLLRAKVKNLFKLVSLDSNSPGLVRVIRLVPLLIRAFPNVGLVRLGLRHARAIFRQG